MNKNDILRISKTGNKVWLKNGSILNTNKLNRNLWVTRKKKINYVNKYIYYTPIPKELKKQILKRDNYQCQICGQKEHIAIHHFDGSRMNNTYWNLLTVCPCCHRLIHAGYF